VLRLDPRLTALVWRAQRITLDTLQKLHAQVHTRRQFPPNSNKSSCTLLAQRAQSIFVIASGPLLSDTKIITVWPT